MTTDSADAQWTVQELLDLFDAAPGSEGTFTAQTGPAGEDERQVVEGTQVLAQSIVAAAKRFPEKSVRSVYSVFARAVMVGAGPVGLALAIDRAIISEHDRERGRKKAAEFSIASSIEDHIAVFAELGAVPAPQSAEEDPGLGKRVIEPAVQETPTR